MQTKWVINFGVFFLVNSITLAAGQIYPGEYIDKSYQGIPALVRFIENDAHKPLVVFVPGSAHLARIAYGFPDGHQEDFLAHWLKGYPFLGISYPIANPVFQETYPEFSIKDWAYQVARIASVTCARERLTKKVIVLVWSLAGVIVVPLAQALKAEGLDLLFVGGLASTGPLPNLVPNQLSSIVMQSDHLVDRLTLRRSEFLEAIHLQNTLNGRIVIPEHIYLDEFLGNHSVNLINTSIRFKNARGYTNFAENIADSRAFDYESYPLVATLVGDSLSDERHTLGDKSLWTALNVQMLLRKCAETPQTDKDLNRFRELKAIIREVEQNLFYEIDGGHAFFVGQQGAKETAKVIEQLEVKVEEIKGRLRRIGFRE